MQIEETFVERPFTVEREARSTHYRWEEKGQKYVMHIDRVMHASHHYEVSFAALDHEGNERPTDTLNAVDATNVVSTAIAGVRHHIRHVVGEDKSATNVVYHFSAVPDFKGQPAAESKRHRVYQRVVAHNVDPGSSRFHPMFAGVKTTTGVTPAWTSWTLKFPRPIHRHLSGIKEARHVRFNDTLARAVRVAFR